MRFLAKYWQKWTKRGNFGHFLSKRYLLVRKFFIFFGKIREISKWQREWFGKNSWGLGGQGRFSILRGSPPPCYTHVLNILYVYVLYVNSTTYIQYIQMLIFERFHFALSVQMHLQLDNTAKENKNRHLMNCLGWLVKSGILDTITVGFLPKGHTHVQVDCFV